MPISLADYVPHYARIAAVIAERIDAGIYQTGSQMPTEVDLIAEFQVARPTIRQAIAVLREHNYVAVVHGRGTYVL